MNRTIIIIANKYPNHIEPNVNVFTQQIAWSFADCGCECIVICPTAVNYKAKNYTISESYIEKTDTGKEIRVFRPKYFGFGQSGDYLVKSRVFLTTVLFTQAVERVLKKLSDKDPVLFAEFICPTGVCAAGLGKKYGLKTVIQCGESTYQGDKKYGNRNLKNKFQNVDLLIALSGHVKNCIMDAGIIDEEKIVIMPSGYRKNVICRLDKNRSRELLSLPLDKFIVGFCGSYDDRKGVLRLVKAVDAIKDEDIVIAAVGKGKLWPSSPKLVLSGPINHDKLSYFYSGIDVFAFPTYNEGCCTAIVEAIACGSPIISSDRAFNYEICDDTNSILIDPDDIDAMTYNIQKLKEDKELCQRLSEGSYEKGKGFDLVVKAENILNEIDRL